MAETGLRLRAAAKINWTLEVTGRRDDGYHELCTVLQTLDLADTVITAPDQGLTLEMSGPAAKGAGGGEANLALRAAVLLRDRFGVRTGARIRIEKRIPAAAGLGGGSSDAAATLRGLARIWQLDLSAEALAALAAELGSDAPFFVYGGTALAEGRGERVTPLPDGPSCDLALLPAQGDDGKTARLFRMLRTADLDDGAATARLSHDLRDDRPLTAVELESRYLNTFERVADAAFVEIAARREALAAATGHRPLLAGAGPTLFALAARERPLPPGVLRVRTTGRAEALAVETHDG